MRAALCVHTNEVMVMRDGIASQEPVTDIQMKTDVNV